MVVPSLNFVAAANTIKHTGAEPVFCDIVGPEDLNLDPADVEAAVIAEDEGDNCPALRAVFPVTWPRLDEIAERHGIAVVEDAAHAPGASLGGRMCGTLGNVGCFSFFANKNLPVGEGGMIVTERRRAGRDALRLLRSHGMTTLTWDRHRGHASSYDVVLPGFNYRLDEVRAAVGTVQLRRLPEENAGRARIAARYREALDGQQGLIDAVRRRRSPTGCRRTTWQSCFCPRALIVTVSAARSNEGGIQTSVHYPPIHTFSAYRSEAGRPLPQTDAVAERLLTLPLYGRMTDEQVDAVVEGLLQTL